ncbi:MAG: hypothetical protein JO036_21920 [Candidatus Eremiobacteraeota bacterium]|nr:hypothetical protein [Candidatus Eremiobacteraeota bacterium]
MTTLASRGRGCGSIRDRRDARRRSRGAEVIRRILRREGYAAQRSVVAEVNPSEAPVLSLDAAMLLVETALLRAGAKSATREEVQDAMADLVRAAEAIRIKPRRHHNPPRPFSAQCNAETPKWRGWR